MAAIINQLAASSIIRSNTLFVSSFPSSSSSSSSHRDVSTAAIHLPKIINTNNNRMFIPPIANIGLVEDQMMDNFPRISTHNNKNPRSKSSANDDHQVIMEKLYAILEAVSDRVEMHKNIGEQRSNWNSLLLTSINTITLSAATIAGIAAAITTSPAAGAPLEALKLSSTFLYLAATGILVIMNKIQPSQLAEEQRNAARLFKQLETEIKTKIAIGYPTDLTDVNHEAMEKVLALDRAYPLPLIGVMLEKFPAKVEPAVWWPEQRIMKTTSSTNNGRRRRQNDKNGWSNELEEEMREIVRVLEIKDKDDYLRLGKKAVKLNKALAIAGPLVTGLGAIGSACIASGHWATMLGVMGGAMASVVNTIQHGGQVGMVFEMYRSNAGFFEMMEESIESNLKEKNLESRENGGVYEMKVALRLGRSLSELRDFAASRTVGTSTDIQEFGSKLF